MARTTKRGTCELCGASANVGMNHGAKVCPQCTHVQSALNKRIESVAAAARSMGKTEDLLGHLIPAGGLAVKVTADLLQEISGIVGYDGEAPGELVAAVRRRVLTCASCEAEDVLAEIREIVGYVPEQGDNGLADMVRQLVACPSVDCGKCTTLRGDLLRACGLEMDDTEDGEGWDVAAAAAVQTIAEADKSIGILVSATDENKESIKRLLAENDEMRGHIAALRSTSIIGESQVAKLRAELYIAEQSRDEWEQRCAAAEESMQDMEAELCDRDNRSATNSDNTYLLDIALKALRGEGPDADQLAVLIDAARRAA